MALEARLTSRGRIVRNTTETIEVTVYDDGTAEDPTGTPTYTITKADGTSLGGGSVTVAGSSSGKLTIALAAQANLNVLKIAITGTWNGASQTFVQYVEVVGFHLFSEAQARAFHGGLATNAPTAISDPDIAAERDRITDLLARWTGVSWVPRFKRYQVAGSGQRSLDLPNHRLIALLAATIGSTAQTVADITVDKRNGSLVHEGQNWISPTVADPLNVVVEYEHGYEYIVDGVDRTALKLLKARLVPSSIDDRATSYTDNVGQTYRYLTAGEKRHTGIPEVDAWLCDHNERLPV